MGPIPIATLNIKLPIVRGGGEGHTYIAPGAIIEIEPVDDERCTVHLHTGRAIEVRHQAEALLEILAQIAQRLIEQHNRRRTLVAPGGMGVG